MIVTLTPNPSIDRTVSIDRLVHGEVHRATASRIDPGGKGINVSRALAANGTGTIAVLPAGGPEGNLMLELLAAAGITYAAVPVSGVMRMNIAVVEPDGTTTKLNEPGPVLSADELAAIETTTVETLSQGARWLVGCGSLPPGVADDYYAALVAAGHAASVKVAIDTSGPPLVAALPAHPDLIKPNLEELEELVGMPMATLADVRDAATTLVDGGVETVLVSLGRHGALLVQAGLTAYASAAVDKPLSTVGAGDSTLAGYLHALSAGATAPEALKTGVSWGSAAVSLPGSRMPGPADVATIHAELTTEPNWSMSLT